MTNPEARTGQRTATPQSAPASTQELQARIAELEAEIARLRKAAAPEPGADLRRHPPILDQIQDAIFWIDLAGTITDCNRGAEQICDYSAEELRGLHFSVLCFDNNRAAMNANVIAPVLQAGQHHLELSSRRKSGEACELRLSLSLLHHESGEAYGVLAIASDITREKRAADGLERSEERLRLAMRSFEGLVYDWDLRTGAVHRTGELEKILGITPEEAEPTEAWWTARIHPDDRAPILKETDSLRSGPERPTFATEYRVRHAAGHWVHVAESGYVVRDKNNLPVRVIGTTRDITDRTKLQRELNFQAAILASTNDAVIALDPEERVTYCNAAVERIYGVPKSQVLGQPLSHILTYAWLNPEHEKRARAALAEKGAWTGENIHIRNDGSEIVVSSAVNILPASAGGGILAVIRDISDKERAELEVRRYAAQLERANKDLLHFAYAVSHDLQTPLRTVINFTQLLALRHKGTLGEDADEYIRLIIESGSRMNTMLRDLLQFASVAGSDIQLQSVSLEDALSTALKNLRAEINEARARVTHDPLPLVDADPGQLVQLFQNLAGNAIKYRKRDVAPAIHVSADRAGNEWIVSVQDNGIGFAQKHAEKIFGVFQRLHNAQFPGTGIGLTISRRIVERFGGRIWATAQPGTGAVFSFSIPIREAAQPGQSIGLDDGAPAQTEAVPEMSSVTVGDDSTQFDEVFRTLDLAPGIVRDLDGTIRIWTHGAENQFGWSKQEALGRQTHDLFQTEFPVSLQEIESELLRNGAWSGELKQRTRDGRTVWHLSHWTLYRDGAGRPRSVIEVNSDVTALKDAERVLRRAVETRDLALRAGQMGVWRWDTRIGSVVWDETLQAILQLPTDSFEGTEANFFERVHPDDAASLRNYISETLAKGSEHNSQFRARRGDGVYRWLRAQGRVVLDAQNLAIGLTGLVWDVTEQQNAARELRESEEKFRTAFRNAAIGFVLATPQGQVLEVNRRYCELTGYSEEELLQGSLSSLVHPEDQEENNRVIERLLNGEVRDFVVENRYRRKDDSAIFVRKSLSVLRDARGKPSRLMALVEDIEERKMAERALRESETRFRILVENATDGFFLHDDQGRFIDVSRRACENLGYSRQEMLAMSVCDIQRDFDLAAAQKAWNQIEPGTAWTLLGHYRRKDGSDFPVEARLSTVDIGGRKVFLGLVRDLTEANRAEEALRTSEARFRGTFENAAVGIAHVGLDGRWLQVNQRLCDFLGYSKEELLPLTFSDITHPDDLEADWALARAAIAGQINTYSLEKRYRRKDGSFVWANLTVSLTRDSSGNPEQFISVVEDISERKRAEHELAETAESLRLAQTAASIGIWDWNLLTGEIRWSPEIYDFYGIDVQDVQAQANWIRKVHPDDLTGIWREFERAVAERSLFDTEFRVVRDDGSVIWIISRGRVIHDGTGKAVRMLGVNMDVTARHLAELALQERTAQLEALLINAPIGLAFFDHSHRYVRVNHALAEMNGIPVSRHLGRAIAELLPITAGQVDPILHKVFSGGVAVEAEIAGETPRSPGVLRYWLMTFYPVFGSGSEVTEVGATVIEITDRKRAEEALVESEQIHRFAFDFAPVGMAYVGIDGTFKRVNEKLCEITGYAASRLTGMKVTDLTHPDDLGANLPDLMPHLRGDMPVYRSEKRYVRNDGSDRWVVVNARMIYDAAGQPRHSVAVIQDIHDRKLAEDALREQEHQLRTMIDSIDQLAWMAHGDGFLFWYNRRWYEYTGTTPEQMEGWGWQAVHDPSVLPEVMEHWTSSIDNGESFEMEFPIRGADGIYRSFLTRGVPLRDSSGKIVRWFGTNTDIEELRREQESLRESERKFRELAESLPEFVWAAEESGRITYLSPQWCVYTGLSAEPGSADHWSAVIHPEDFSRMSNEWQAALASGKRYENEARTRRYDGVYRWFLNRAEPVRDQHGRILKWLGTSTDIHQLKLTEDALRRSNADLEQFAYAASHDLREPLRMVSIFTEKLIRQIPEAGDDPRRFARYIVSGAKRMDALLEGILAYSRAGDIPLEARSVDSEGVLNHVLLLLAPEIRETAATVSYDGLPAVHCAEAPLAQIFHTLIGNALTYHAADRPPRIHVSTSRLGRWRKFAVRDNGIGIKPEYLEHIFGIFKRLHKDEYPGAGVGLAIAKRIVERQGGRIWAESEPGIGSTFYFTLAGEDDK